MVRWGDIGVERVVGAGGGHWGAECRMGDGGVGVFENLTPSAPLSHLFCSDDHLIKFYYLVTFFNISIFCIIVYNYDHRPFLS